MDPLTEVLFDEEKKRMQFPVSFAIVCVTAGFVVYFYSQEDYGTATATAVLGVALRSGYRAGASTYLGFLAGVVLAMFAAAPVGKLLAPVFQQVFGTHGVTNRLLSVGTVGSIMILMLTLWVRNHIRRQFRNRPWLKNYDKLLGLALGGVQGCVIFLVMAGGAIIVEPFARNALSTRRSDGGAIQRFAQRAVVVAETTRSGTIGPYVAAWNPFEHIGVLKSLMQGMAVL